MSNIFCWLEGISVNQVLTIVISVLVVIYWIGRLRNNKIEREINVLKLKALQAQDN